MVIGESILFVKGMQTNKKKSTLVLFKYYLNWDYMLRMLSRINLDSLQNGKNNRHGILFIDVNKIYI